MKKRILRTAQRNSERLGLEQTELPIPADEKAIAMLNNQKGFTLIEVLIAMAIFSIGILGLTTLLLSTARSVKIGNAITQATMLARDQIETLERVTDVTTLSSGVETNIDAQGNPGGIYNRSWTISNPLGGSKTRQILVIVSWSHHGKNRSVELSTIIKK